MSVAKGKAAPVSNNKNQPQPKKGQDTKPVKREWAAEDYVSPTVSIDEVREIKAAFDVFDSDGSGVVDPVELKNAFVSLGFAASNKFVYNILNDLDTEHAGGLTFAAFLKLATGKLGETHTRADIENVFKSFDLQKNVLLS
jgi:centrin-1